MKYRFVMVPPNVLDHWPTAIQSAVPECEVLAFDHPEDAFEAIREADAAYGDIVPELFEKANKLRWIAAPRAGLGGDWFHEALVQSDVVVTNTKGIFDDHLSHHILGLIIAHSRHFEYYADLQRKQQWGPGKPIQHIPGCTLLILGCGAAGQATAKLAKAFGMTVLATDAREQGPIPGVDELHPPSALDDLLPRADYVAMILPETPSTRGLMGQTEIQRMKPGSYLINVGRGSTLCLSAVVDGLQTGILSGASLDVFEIEPLPAEHELWGFANVRITPHVAGEGPHCWERRLELLIENCRRFAAGEPLKNVVDKTNWF